MFNHTLATVFDMFGALCRWERFNQNRFTVPKKAVTSFFKVLVDKCLVPMIAKEEEATKVYLAEVCPLQGWQAQ